MWHLFLYFFHWYAFPNFCAHISCPLAYSVRISSQLLLYHFAITGENTACNTENAIECSFPLLPSKTKHIPIRFTHADQFCISSYFKTLWDPFNFASAFPAFQRFMGGGGGGIELLNCPDLHSRSCLWLNFMALKPTLFSQPCTPKHNDSQTSLTLTQTSIAGLAFGSTLWP